MEDKEIEKTLKKNMGYLLEMQLALEDYSDDTGDSSIYKEECFEILKSLRTNMGNENISVLCEKSELALSLFNKLLDKIGRDKFVFSKDGYISYIWKHKVKK